MAIYEVQFEDYLKPLPPSAASATLRHPPPPSAASAASATTSANQNIVRRRKNVLLKTKMNQCPICYQSFSRSDVMLRHKRNVHMKEKFIDPLPPVVKSTNMTFKHPFSMVVSGPSGSGKSVWTLVLPNTTFTGAYHMVLRTMATPLR